MGFVFDLDLVTPLSKVTGSTSTGDATTNYNDLINKPMINGVILTGNKTTTDLSISYNDLHDLPEVKEEIYGIKSDYCSKYGIISAQYGLVEYETLSNEVIVKGGIQLIIPNKDNKILIASDIKYEVQSIVDVTLFYADGEIIEADDVYYQTQEPPEDGQFAYTAWWNPEVKKWSFKSNDTGNVWRQADATPIADVHFSNENIVRIDHVGYRHLNTMMFATQDDLLHTSTELEELAEELGTVSNIKADRNLSNITNDGKNLIKNIIIPESIVIDEEDLVIDELESNKIYHCGTLSNLIISALDISECVPESIIRFTADDSTMVSLPSGLLKLNELTFTSGKQYILRIYDKMVSVSEILGLT